MIPEGFTSSELSTFEERAAEGIDFLFQTEPYKTYRDYFNVYFLNVPSQESGASITDGNGNVTTKRDTYFGAKWGENSYSDMSANADAIYGFVSDRCPEIANGTLSIQDVPILMLINDSRYGGVCGSGSDGRGFAMVPYTYGGDNLSWSIYQLVASQNEPVPEGSNYNDYVHPFTAEELSAIGSSVGTWKNVLVHEFGGHCFGRLLDEYWYTSFYTSQVAIDSHSWPVPFGLNVSGFYETVPWDYLLTNLEDLVASDGNYARIGRYQGGGVMVFNRWRSEIISCMIDNRSYFSAWQRMLIVKRIMERTGMEFSNDSFFTKDVTTDPIRDVVSNPVLGIDPTRPVHAVPLLPPPVLTEE